MTHGSWHSIDWLQQILPSQISTGDVVWSPFVAAGWSEREELNARPAQWLGLLKLLTVTGSVHPIEITTLPYTKQLRVSASSFSTHLLLSSHVHHLNAHTSSSKVHAHICTCENTFKHTHTHTHTLTTGAEWFYMGFFSLHPPFPDSRNWIWQAAAPAYAQAVASNWLDVLYNGELLQGDAPVPPISCQVCTRFAGLLLLPIC